MPTITTNTDTKLFDGDGSEKTVVVKGNFGNGRARLRASDDSGTTFVEVFPGEPTSIQASPRIAAIKVNTGISIYLTTEKCTSPSIVATAY